MARRAAPLLRLPDELLLKIAHCLASRRHDKNLDLVNLATVCRRFAPIASEVLLTRPVIRLFDIVGVVRAYLDNPGLANKIYSVEITTASRDFQKRADFEDLFKPTRNKAVHSALPITPPVDLTSLKLEQLFWVKCVGTIRKAENLTYDEHQQWVEDLTCPNTYLCAWLALLLMLIPNVQELLLGQNYLPFLSGIVGTFGRSKNVPKEQESPQYCFEVARRLQAQLQVLELPAFWYYGVCRGRYRFYAPIPMLAQFCQLKTLTVPFRVLVPTAPQSRQHDDDGKVPLHILPSSIEVLRIVDIDSTEIKNDLLQFINGADTSFPNLHRVELYHQWAPDKLNGINGGGNTRGLAVDHDTLQQILVNGPTLQQAINNATIQQIIDNTIDYVNLRAQEYQSALHNIATNALSLGIEMHIWFPAYGLQAVDAYGHPWQYTEEELRKLEYEVAVEREKYLISERLEQYRCKKEKEGCREETVEEMLDRAFSGGRRLIMQDPPIGVAGEVMPGTHDPSDVLYVT